MTHSFAASCFEVRRDDPNETRFVRAAEGPLAEGEVLFRIDRFALTANNITYAQTGNVLGYWNFFPADEGWGRIPAMGFADVIASEHSEVAVGERVWGFFPMGTHLKICAGDLSTANFSDRVSHRAETAPVYRQYSRSSSDAIYQPEHEDAMMLMRGLFLTSFLVDDYIGDNDCFGANAFVVSSASSKTGLALGYQLAQRDAGAVIGLTSARNADFVTGLGCFDSVVLYEDVESLPAGVPTVFVDHAGNSEVVNSLHHHFGENMIASLIVGATHVGETGQRQAKLPGAEPEFFFAPSQVQKRVSEWGAGEFQKRVAAAWKSFRASTDTWLEVVRGYGEADVEHVYRKVRAGEALPKQGHILSLHSA